MQAPAVTRHLARVGRRFRAPVLTLGVFDGVHVGHQTILHRVADYARAIGGTPVALTFVPHPSTVLDPTRVPPMLTDWRTRVGLIVQHGVPNIVVQRFTLAFAATPAEDFIHQHLIDALGLQGIIVGHRVRFGQGGRGDSALLQRIGNERGIHVEVVGPVSVDNTPVSSSAVRKAVLAGDLPLAERLLARVHAVGGRVVHGHHRGRSLGFPTANLAVGRLALPADGVYAVRTVLGDERFDGVANIGRNPTFGDNARTLEVHLLDFDRDIYGRRLEVEFIRRLRGEVKFNGVAELVAQITRDAAAAREILRS